MSHEGYQVAANHEQVFEYKEKVKSFIRSTIQSAVEREREEVVRKIEGMMENPSNNSDEQWTLYDVLEVLKSK